MGSGILGEIESYDDAPDVSLISGGLCNLKTNDNSDNYNNNNNTSSVSVRSDMKGSLVHDGEKINISKKKSEKITCTYQFNTFFLLHYHNIIKKTYFGPSNDKNI